MGHCWSAAVARTAARPQVHGVYHDLRGKRRSAGTYSQQEGREQGMAEGGDRQAAGQDRRSSARRRQTCRRYVEDEWFPNHLLEATTRQTYRYLLDRYVLTRRSGDMRMVEVLPSHVREWVDKLERDGARPPTIQYCKVILDAIFTTALNDQITFLHPARG